MNKRHNTDSEQKYPDKDSKGTERKRELQRWTDSKSDRIKWKK